MRVALQDPGETLPYTLDWSDFLGDDGATIDTADWAISPSSGPTLSLETQTDTTTTVYVDGLSHGVIYTLTGTIKTDGGVVGERSITIRGAQR